MDIDILNKIIAESIVKLNDDLQTIWDDIKVSPVKWLEATHKDFWVVAITGNEVIWYNDIEKGFNISTYKTEGEILDYWTEDTKLDELLWHLF